MGIPDRRTRRALPFLLATLTVLGACSRAPEPVDLYAVRTYWLAGSRDPGANEAPLLPGETAVQHLAATLTDVERMRATLEATFGYRQIQLKSTAALLAYPREGAGELFWQLGDTLYLRCILYSPVAEGRIPVSVTVLGHDGPSPGSPAGIRRLFDAEGARPLIFTRADVQPGQAVALGRAGEAVAAHFLVIRVDPAAPSSLDGLSELVAEHRLFLESSDGETVERLLTPAARRFGIDGDSLLARAGIEPRVPGKEVPMDVLSVRPRFRDFTSPVYPESAKSAGIEGGVICQAVIDEHGRVTESLLLKTSGHAELDSAAMRALRRSTFHPGEVDGEPVRTRVTVPYRFKLQ